MSPGPAPVRAAGEGGEVHIPLSATSWSSGFGMLADRFGTPWMISVDETPDRA